MARRRLLPGFVVIAVGGVAFLLIFVVVARSPYTHANLQPQDYNRTEIAYVGEDQPFEGPGLANPSRAVTGDPVKDGRALFFKYGCSSCHGLEGQGGVVGKEISGDSALKISTTVRNGPKTMPSFDTNVLPDADLQKLIAFLQSVGQ
jgi:mono/diheme cytochrome c family protein